MLEGFKNRRAAALGRTPSIRADRNEHDRLTGWETPHPVQHQHPVGTVRLSDPFRIVVNPPLTHPRVMDQLQGIQGNSALILGTNRAEEHRMGRCTDAPLLQTTPWLECLGLNLDLHRPGLRADNLARAHHLNHR